MSGASVFTSKTRQETPDRLNPADVGLMDGTFWPRIAGGCCTGRDTTTAVEQAGFTIERLDQFRMPDMRTPASAHVLGVATP
jgi:hypothetical protein